MATATTTVETKTKTKVKKKAPAKLKEGVMPPQTEPGVVTVDPRIEKLFEEPTFVGEVKVGTEMFVKCNRPGGKSWVRLANEYLGPKPQDGTAYEIQTGAVHRVTLKDVTLTSQVVKSLGCGDTSGGRIGYATGKQLVSGSVNSKMDTHIVKYERSTGRFMLDGLEVIGAEAMILGDGCIGLIVGPIFAQRGA